MRVEPFLKDAVGEYQDRGRDDVPRGYVWSMLDFVPRITGATLRNRGYWSNNTNALTTAPRALAWAPYAAGGKLISLTNTQAHEISPSGGAGSEVLIGTVNSIGATLPHFYRNKLYIPSSGSVPQTIAWNGASYTIANLTGVGAPIGSHFTSYKDRLVVAQQDTLWFAKPGDPTIAWDATSFFVVNGTVMGLFAMRNKILVFHANNVEQLTGTTPPDASLSDPTGDMSLGVMWSSAGCFDGRSIAAWQENVIFADERGVHLTDGGQVRNMIEQGGMSRKWREPFEKGGGGLVDAVGATVFGNYYIVCVSMDPGEGPSYTWLCDIPTRRWFRWTNIESRSFAATSGNVERLLGTDTTARKVINMEYCLKPQASQVQTDGNGVNVLPVVETPWQRLSNRVGLRRIYDVFLYYLANHSTPNQADVVEVAYTDTSEDVTYEVIGTLDEAVDSKRRKLLVARRVEGVAFKVRALLPFQDFRVHSLGISVEAEEEHRVA